MLRNKHLAHPSFNSRTIGDPRLVLLIAENALLDLTFRAKAPIHRAPFDEYSAIAAAKHDHDRAPFSRRSRTATT